MATFTKLKSGGWGVRVDGDVPAVGASITVTKKDGSTSVVKVARVVWSDPAGRLHLCALAEERRGNFRGRRSNGGRYECEECGDMVFPGTRCWETGCSH